jgi:DNA-binding MarR family transcriptional regulator
VNAPSREETLKRLRSDVGMRLPRRDARAEHIGWDDVGFVAEGLAFAPRALREATRSVTERHSLGPRGAWILNLLSHGVVYPLELASVFNVGRSLITAELTRLSDAGLIASRPGTDRRKTELSLTDAGRAACAEIRSELSRVINGRLAGFEPGEVRLAAEVMKALSNGPAGPDC